MIPSEKAFSKDNQQERLKFIGWIVGFVDGEGCFTVTLHKNPTTSLGYQIMPEFVLSQGEKSKSVLYTTMKFFNCGRISVNRRHDNHRENLFRYSVKSQKELLDIIIPFFKENNLKTSKKDDFEKFSEILLLMKNKVHLTKEGVNEIIKIIETMNTRKKRNQSVLESSETIRRTRSGPLTFNKLTN